jgi:hypothetical protein
MPLRICVNCNASISASTKAPALSSWIDTYMVFSFRGSQHLFPTKIPCS